MTGKGKWYCIVKWDRLGEMYYFSELGWTMSRGLAMLFPYHKSADEFSSGINDLGTQWRIKEF